MSSVASSRSTTYQVNLSDTALFIKGRDFIAREFLVDLPESSCCFFFMTAFGCAVCARTSSGTLRGTIEKTFEFQTCRTCRVFGDPVTGSVVCPNCHTTHPSQSPTEEIHTPTQTAIYFITCSLKGKPYQHNIIRRDMIEFREINWKGK